MKKFIDPDETFLDASNLPSFNRQQFEGQIERPIKRRTFQWLGLSFLFVAIIFLGRAFQLQIAEGQTLAERSTNNTLRRLPIFAARGLVTDRLGTKLVWNDDTGRHYFGSPGFAHVLGYVAEPTAAELSGGQLPNELIGRDGAEKIFNQRLRGEPGTKIEEVDVGGKVISDYLLEPPAPGDNLTLSLDARLQAEFSRAINNLVTEGRFVAGAGLMLDVHTGEILALTSLPEYDPNVLLSGSDQAAITKWLNDTQHPFLNRAVAGLYTPGSIIKPIIATGVLTEGIIDPAKKILSTGQLIVPNPYFPDQPSIFKDWKPQGWVDMRQAIAVSSDIYFYTVGGGAPGQAGLGIEKIADYAARFGLGQKTGSPFTWEEEGVVPTPAWKKANFNGANWLLGDTYHTAIGQYGFQVTPLQVARAIAAVANGGYLITPTLLANQPGDALAWQPIAGLKPADLQIVREGMRRSVEVGTAHGLDIPAVALGGKTGTAELGTTKQLVNSWVAGFFPYDSPRYAFAIVMERGQATNLIGATFAMRQVLDWMTTNTPEYFKG